MTSLALSGFAVICVQKSLELGSDDKLHKANKDRELHEELEQLTSAGQTTQGTRFMYQPGGGVRADGKDVVIACVGDSVAAFQGKLANYDALKEVFPLEDSGADAADGAAGKQEMNEAALMCTMYSKLGLALLAQLQGRFSFCLYESKKMRVLAARDGRGLVPLFQARSSKDSLVITTNDQYLQASHDVLEFKPGEFKYGWSAPPRMFDPAEVLPRMVLPAHPQQHGPNAHGGSRGSGRGGRGRRMSMDHAQQQGKQPLAELPQGQQQPKPPQQQGKGGGKQRRHSLHCGQAHAQAAAAVVAAARGNRGNSGSGAVVQGVVTAPQVTPSKLDVKAPSFVPKASPAP